MYNDEILISQGANSDDDSRHVPAGFYRELWYARLGESVGHGFCVVTARGTEIVENETLTLLDLVVGCKGWVEGDSVIYMVWKESGIHEIWRYYVLTETHVLLNASTIWNFQKDKKIAHIVVGINNIVAWCDGYFESQQYTGNGTPLFNEPFYIDVQKMESGDYPTPLTLQDVQFAKWPFWSGPVCVYGTDTTKADNKLRSKLYRFRVTPIYWGNEEAALSGYSQLVTPNLSEFVSGTNYVDSSQDNVIYITIETGPAVIRKINVAVSMNGGQFGVFMQIDKDLLSLADDTTYTFPYYGNAVTLPVPFNTRNEDVVPMVAETMALLPTKEIEFANYITGRDKEEMDVTIEPVYHEVQWAPITPVMTVVYNDPLGVFELFLFNATTSILFQEGDVITIPFYNSATDIVYYSYEVTQELADLVYGAIGTPTAKNQYFLMIIGDALGIQFGATQTFPVLPVVSGTDLIYSTAYTPTDLSTRSLSVITNRRTLARPDHIKGAHYQYGVQYYDEQGRAFTVWTSEDLSMYVPFYSEADAIAERVANFVNVSNPYTITATITLNHIPPIGAAYYRIVRRNTTDISVFQEVTMVEMVPDGDRWKITLQGNGVNDYEKRYLGAAINQQITKGDKVRFIRQHTGNLANPTASDSLYVQTYFELEVQEYDPENRVITTERFDPSLINFVVAADVAQLLQIYTPSPTLDTEGTLFVAPWRELSDVFLIGQPHTENRFHWGRVEEGGDVTDSLTGFYWMFDGDQTSTLTVGNVISIITDVESVSNPIQSVVYDVVNDVTQVTLVGIAPTSDDQIGQWYYGQNQYVEVGVSQLPAVIDSIQGDVWFRQRDYGTGYSTLNTHQFFFINDPWYSDYWVESRLNDNGRLAIESPFAKMVFKIATALHGGKLIDNTQVNNLCLFELLYEQGVALNIKEMDDQWGPITASIVDGKTLKCIQKKKENSIYINFAGFAITTDSNQEILPQPGTTFSQWRPYDSNFGTSDAGSVVLVPGKGIAYFDRISGVFVMSLNNGQVEISNYIQREGGSYDAFKYKQRALELTEQCRTYPTYIVSYVDETNGEIGWGFVSEVLPGGSGVIFGVVEGENETVIFGDYTGYIGGVITFLLITDERPEGESFTTTITDAYLDEEDPAYSWIIIADAFPVTSFTGTWQIEPLKSYSIDTFDYVRMVWRTRYDYPFQRFANIGNKLFGFGGNAQLYLHNIEGAVTWHGDAAIERWILVSNKDSNIMKRFTNLVLKSTKKWDMSLAETTDALSYGTQQTSLSQNEFTVKGNLIAARIKRDRNSPNFATPAEARLLGNEMRGQAIEITIEREVDGQTVTYGAVVRGQESETII